MQSGRVYGNGVYLSRDLQLAALLEPHSCMDFRSSGIQYLSLGGQLKIALSETPSQAAQIPDGYCAISDMSRFYSSQIMQYRPSPSLIFLRYQALLASRAG